MKKNNTKPKHLSRQADGLFRRQALASAICLGLAGLATTASAAQVTTLLDLEDVGGQAYTLYSYTFQAQLTQTYITFEFRQDPAYWRLDDVSFTLASAPGSELLTNGGFEGGSYGGQNTPNGWTLIGQAGLSAGGEVSSGCGHAGSYCYNDGAVGGVDGLYQSIATTIGQSYTLNFWLAGDGGSPASAVVQVGESLDNGGVLVPAPPSPTTTDMVVGQTYTTTDYAGGTLNPVFDGGTLQFDSSTTLADNFSITANNGTIDTNGHNAVMSGVLSDASGSGALTVSNSGSGGSLILTGDNTYSGGTTINSGANLAIGNGGTTGSISGDVVNNGNLIFDRSNNLTYGGNISGNGALTQAGSGILTLSGTNTYAGATTISAGTLRTGAINTLSNLSNISIASGATLDLNNFSQSINALTGAGNITLGSAILTANGSTNTTFSGVISGSGGLTQNGSGILTLSGTNTYTGTTTISSGTLRAGAINTLSNLSNVSIASGAIFDLNNFSQSINSLTGAGNITLGSATVTTNSNTNSTFSGVISGSGGLTQNGTGILTLSGANTYTGSTTISSGTLRAGAINTLSNLSNVSIASGATFDLNNFSQSINSLTGAGNITLGSATLTANGSTNTAFSGVISGSGGLTQHGSGILTISGANTYTGATTISSGTLRTGAANMMSNSSGVSIASGATFDLNNFSQSVNVLSGSGNIALGNATLTTNSSANSTFSGIISGNGGLTQNGSGILTLAGANIYTGATTISSGTLRTGATNSLSNTSNVSVASGATLDLNNFSQSIGSLAGQGNISLGTATLTTNSSANTEFAGVMTGSGGLTHEGIGTLTLTGINTFTGATTINNGRVSIGNGGSIAGDIVDNSELQFNRTDNVTFNHTISGSGRMIQSGSGTLTLAGTNSYSGGTRVEAGTVQISNDAALGAVSGALTLNNGALQVTADTVSTRNIVLEAGNNTIDTASGVTLLGLGTISGAGALVKAGDGMLVLTATNNYLGGTIIDGGILRVDSGAQLGSGSVTLSGGILQTSTDVGTDQNVMLAPNTVIDTDAGTTALLTGTVVSSGSGSCFEKTGAGTLNLTGSATLSNGTCVEEGTLRANGTLISNVSVDEGAMLRGSGHIAGNLNVNGTLAPGNSPGTLTVNGTVTMTPVSSLQIDIDGLGTGTGAGNYSRVLVTGAGNQFIADGALTPLLRGITGNANNNFTPALGDQFRIVTAEGGISGRFNSLQQPTAGLAANTRFSVFYNMANSNSIDLRVTPTSYANYVQGNRNTHSAGSVLDRINATNDNGSATAVQTELLYRMAALNAAQLPSATKALTGEVHGAMAASAVQSTRKIQSVVERQLATSRGKKSDDFLWIDTSTMRGHTGSDNYASAFDNDRTQLIIGADLLRSERGRFGVGISNSDNDVSARSGSGALRATTAFVYGNQQVGHTVIDGTAAYGNSRWNTDRSDVLDNVGALKTHADGHDAMISVGASLPLQIRSATVAPFARASWQRSERDSTDEGNATSSALSLKDYSANGVRLVAGLAGGSQQKDPLAQRVTYRYSVGLGTDTGDLARPGVNAELADEKLTIEAPHVSRNFAQANIGATIKLGGSAYGYIGVDSEVREGSNDIGANAGLNMRF